MQPIPTVACFGEFLPLVSSSDAEIHVQSDLNLKIDLGDLRLYISLPCRLLSCCNMKRFPMNLVTFYIYIYIYAFSRCFYPKQITWHSSYSFYILSALAFPGNRTHDLGVARAMLYHLSYRKAQYSIFS